MKIIRKVELKPGSYEEELPGISAEFPYIAFMWSWTSMRENSLPGIGTKRRSCFTWSRAAWNMTRLMERLFLRLVQGAL